MKIVEGLAKRLRVPDGARDIQVFDETLPGFGIRKFKSGKAVYIVKFSVANQQRKLSLGPVVPGVLGAKRKKAAEILMQARAGRDLVGEKHALRTNQPVSIASLVPKFLKDRQADLRDASYVEMARYMERYWADLHPLAVKATPRQRIVEALDKIAEEHGRVAADRARAALSSFFAWAIDRGLLDASPVQGIQRRAASAARTRVLKETELVEVWNACESDDYGRIVRLLILTGQRRAEIGDLSREEIAADWSQIELPPERTKNARPHLVPLTPAALVIVREAILEADRHQAALSRSTSSGKREAVERAFLFGIGAKGFQGWSKAKSSLEDRVWKARRKAGEMRPMPAWTLHDIRRTVVTHLHERGFAHPHVVEAIVNHVSGHRGGVAGVYNKALYLAERRAALTAWGDHLSRLMAREAADVS